jgi:acetyl-CoA decarbonylase/synthase complex subunit gamma
VNPCVFALEIKDTLGEADIEKKIEEILHSEIDRVGQKLRIDAIALTNDSNDAGRFETAAKVIAQRVPDMPLIICTANPRAAENATKLFAGKKPVLYGADSMNAEAMANIAKSCKATLGVAASASGGLNELAELTERIKKSGIEDMVIDSGARKAKDILEHNTLIRRAAIKKNFKPLGYPVITFAGREDNLVETLIASLGVAKYSSIIVLSSIEKWKNLALFTLRQNIYTDPQVPMQVEQKVYNIGEPTPESPLLITTNFSLTYFIVSGEVENSRVPSYLAVMDCEGLSVLTAWAAGKFTASKIAQFIKESGVESNIKHRELIIPGYVAILSGAIEDKLEGWKVTVGPREANGIPAFMKTRAA